MIYFFISERGGTAFYLLLGMKRQAHNKSQGIQGNILSDKSAALSEKKILYIKVVILAVLTNGCLVYNITSFFPNEWLI